MKRVLSLLIVFVMVIPTFAFAIAPSELKVYSRKEIPLAITYGLEKLSDVYLVSGIAEKDSKYYGSLVKLDLDGTVLSKYVGGEGVYFAPTEYNGKYFVVYADTTSGTNKVTLLQFTKDLTLEKEYKSEITIPGVTVISGVLNGNIYITSPSTTGEIVGVKKDSTTSEAGVLNLRTGEIKLATAAEIPDFVKKIKASRSDIAGIPYGYAENDKFFITYGPATHELTGGHYASIYNKTTSTYVGSFRDSTSRYEYQDGDILDNYFYAVATNTAQVGIKDLNANTETVVDLTSFYAQDVVSLLRVKNTTDGLIIADLACVGSTGKCTSGVVFLKNAAGAKAMDQYIADKEAKINGTSIIGGSETEKKAKENPKTGVFTYVGEVSAVIAVCAVGFVLVRKTRKFRNI